MAQHTYEFRPPAWRTPDQLVLHTGVLLIGTLLWTLLYAWLGWRVWHYGLSHTFYANLALALLCILMGTLLFLGWQRARGRWHLHLHKTSWPALSIAELLALTPSDFEEYVAQRVFARQGYQVQNTPDTKDGGIDLIITDRQGRQAIVQCKRYRSTVGEATVRDLYGTLLHSGATMAYLVTTSGISDASRRWAEGKPIGLIDGSMLVQLAKAEPSQQQ
jgi:HJR/Mrr/RecB family endonuclease